MIEFDDLTQGQKEAYECATDLIQRAYKQESNWKAKTTHLTINGPAGTGKSLLMKFIMDFIEKEGIPGVVLAAPTHASKKVLADFTGREVSTIHSILKINPVTYEEHRIFEQRKAPELDKIRVLICEEASFYDTKLFELLMNNIMPWTIVIAIGDKAQLKPQDDPGVSRFFTDHRFKQMHLTEVKRSNQPIIEVATEIREGGWIRENIIDGEGIFHPPSLRDMMIDYFKQIKTEEDFFDNRFFAYTNKSVDKLNQIIRKNFYKKDDPFIIGEALVMQEPYMQTIKFEGKKMKEIIFNNGEVVQILDVKEMTRKLQCRGVDFKIDLPYFLLKVQSVDEGTTNYLNVVYGEENQTQLWMFLGKVAQQYKSGNGRAYWDDFWEIKDAFTKVKPIPCSTIHKAQGVTVKNSFLYTPCIIKYAEVDVASQLLYVGTTRARKNVWYI